MDHSFGERFLLALLLCVSIYPWVATSLFSTSPPLMSFTEITFLFCLTLIQLNQILLSFFCSSEVHPLCSGLQNLDQNSEELCLSNQTMSLKTPLLPCLKL